MAVKEALLARGESQFTDQEFPPSDRSLFPDNPPSKLQVVAAWMRPIEIVEENQLVSGPCLFSGAANSSDVCQVIFTIFWPNFGSISPFYFASLKIYPPFAGAAVSAITLVVAFGFAVSRPCLTLETRNALSGTYSAAQRSASSAALLVGDPAVI
ncbi:unnamed protein product [Cuscuta campestris]|uniref:Calpain catalytic domain-containing protein n=1 Tax=Cuscuta campestris TaxID=132261 RepID=A0A484M9C0_9ASTE|nr:unnamed protein product [Cuscuta campestris]